MNALADAFTVDQALAMVLPLSIGMVLGVFFYGGLWFTVNRLSQASRAGAWMLGSLLLRAGVTAAGFWLVTDGRYERALACLAGFILARVVVTWFTRQMRPPAWKANHAP